MELTKKQAEGLSIALSRFHDHERWTCIAGYAGTGKSTLVSFIIDALDIDRDDVAYISYTGKAALVLKSKGCPNAQTAHKLLYRALPKNDGTFLLIPKRPLDKNYKLIVVDEISMLPKELWDLLLTHHIPIIALGDPGQLPPIGDDNGVLDNPHVFLDEIVRQAQESEIIRLSMDVRYGKPLKLFKGNEVQVIAQSEMVDGMYQWADQILCGKNATRYEINDQIRLARFGLTDPTPVPGDKIISLNNNWQIVSTVGQEPLINGLIGTVKNPVKSINLRVPVVNNVELFKTEFEIEGGDTFAPLNLDAKLFREHEPVITKQNYRYLKNLGIKPFDYAYAITVHKSQGSEYDKVLLLEERLKGSEHQRWLYTGITRAINKLVLVKDFRL